MPCSVEEVTRYLDEPFDFNFNIKKNVCARGVWVFLLLSGTPDLLTL
jgi:hypothetical protein